MNTVDLGIQSMPIPTPPATAGKKDADVRTAFNAFVGEAFYSQMLKEMRKSVGQVAYVGGGQAEEIFTQQLDQMLASKLAENSADKLSGPMFELFQLGRR